MAYFISVYDTAARYKQRSLQGGRLVEKVDYPFGNFFLKSCSYQTPLSREYKKPITHLVCFNCRDIIQKPDPRRFGVISNELYISSLHRVLKKLKLPYPKRKTITLYIQVRSANGERHWIEKTRVPVVDLNSLPTTLSLSLYTLLFKYGDKDTLERLRKDETIGHGFLYSLSKLMPYLLDPGWNEFLNSEKVPIRYRSIGIIDFMRFRRNLKGEYAAV